MYTLLHNIGNKKTKLLTYFLEHPTSVIHLRSLARKLDMSATWVATASKQLHRLGLINLVRHPERKELSLSANFESAQFKAIKRSYNLYALHASGLVEHLTNTYNQPECIVAFGSYAKGEDTEQSDIDIAIITSRKEILKTSKFSKRLGRPLQVKELVKKHISKDFWQTLANGVVLSGYLEVHYD